MKRNDIGHEQFEDFEFKERNSPDLTVRKGSTEQDSKAIPENQVQPDQQKDNEQVVFEPLGRNPYDLSYSCLLIPRFSSQYLMGDLAQRLPEWMQQICISFGWRLELISVKPEYLQWTIEVPPSTSTTYFMKAIRHQTSLFFF